MSFVRTQPDPAAGATSRLRRWSALALAALVPTAWPSCKSDPEVAIALIDPCCGVPDPDGGPRCFRPRAEYTEIAVFEGGCPSDSDLAGGDTSAAVVRLVAAAGEPPPEIGELDMKEYAFSVLLRDASCGVIAFGCTQADLTSIREIRVAVRNWLKCTSGGCPPESCNENASAGCPPGASCSGGTCVSEGGAGDAPPPEGGTGNCSLALKASGDLPAAIAPDARITGPAIAATPTGFAIAYREQDTAPDEGGAPITRVVVATLADAPVAAGDAGLMFQSVTTQLTKSCTGQEPSDGVGIAFSGPTGLVTIGTPNCDNGGAGAAFVALDGAGKITGATELVNPSFSTLALAQAHSLAPAAVANEFLLVYRAIQGATPVVQEGTLVGTGFKTGAPIASLFGGQPSDYGMIATSVTSRGVLGHVPGSTLLEVSAQGAPAGTAITLPEAKWAALAAQGDRIAVVHSGAGDAGIAWKLYGVGAEGGTPGEELGGGEKTGAGYRGGDVTLLRDHLIAVASQATAMTVYRIDGATTAPFAQPTSEVVHQGTISGATTSLANFEGDRVAIASARQRVALAWVNRLKLTGAPGETAGGWALFECIE